MDVVVEELAQHGGELDSAPRFAGYTFTEGNGFRAGNAVDVMTVRMISATVPGVGTSEQLELQDGHRLAVVVRRDGSHDLSVDATAVHLDEAEADAVARALGSAKLVARLARVQHEADAVRVEQLPIPAHSPYSGRPLGETRIRHRTGASIVAVLRDGGAQPSPKPDFVLAAGDLVVAVGTREGLDQVGRILDGTG